MPVNADTGGCAKPLHPAHRRRAQVREILLELRGRQSV